MAVANPIIVASRSGTFEWLTMPRNAMSYKAKVVAVFARRFACGVIGGRGLVRGCETRPATPEGAKGRV